MRRGIAVFCAVFFILCSLAFAGEHHDKDRHDRNNDRNVYEPAKHRYEHEREWKKFNSEFDDKWSVEWDRDTGTPHRISGYFIKYDMEINERNLKKITGDILKKQSELLQVDRKQLKLSNIRIEKAGLGQWGNSYVLYDQYYKGIRVYGGNVRFVFHGQKLSAINSNFYPHISIKAASKLDRKNVAEIAVNAVSAEKTIAPDDIEPVIYPERNDGNVLYHLAYKVVMPVISIPASRAKASLEDDGQDELVPVRWLFFIDADTGIIIDRINLIRSEDLHGTVTGMIHQSLPTDVPTEVSLKEMDVSITQGGNSQTAATDSTGLYEFLNLSADTIDVEAHLKGPYVRVYNSETADPDATFTTTTLPGVLDWNWSGYDPSPNDVETNAFYHVTLIRNWFRAGDPFDITPVSPVGPSEDYVDVHVREPYCNAYSSIGMGTLKFGQGTTCEDSGLCSDIIYHEYSHLAIEQVYADAGVNIWSFDHEGAFHEGFSDYFGCSITGNPHFAGGCWTGRHIDTPDVRYPDGYMGEGHIDGMIISGALWDTRAVLGAGYTDNLAIRALKQATTSFSEYLWAVLEEDDNTVYATHPSANDFPGDGTPNINAICEAFYDDHGIYHPYCAGHTVNPAAVITSPSPLKTDTNFYDGSVTQVQIIGTAQGSSLGTFQYYTIEYMSADAVGTWAAAGMSLANGGTSPVDNGVLGTWDISAIPDGFYLVKLEVTDNGGQTADARVHVYINKEIMNGWPMDTTHYFPSVPVAADIDPAFPGDEIIARERWGNIYAYHLDGSMVPGWPKAAYHWPSTVPPAVADMNGDGLPDVLAAGGNKIYGFMNTGTPLPGWPVTLGQDIGNFYSLAIDDIDGDSLPEVVLAIENGSVFVYNHDGSPAAGWPVFTGTTIHVDVAVADLDTSVNGSEIIVCNDNGELMVFHADGSLMTGWPQTISTPVKASPALADLDGDGDLEIVVGSSSSVHAYHHDGSTVSGWPVNHGMTIQYETGIVLADIDKNGSVEVMLKREGIVGIWNGDGSTYTGAPFVIPGTGSGYFAKHNAPVVGDINLDGDQNLIDGYYFDHFGDPALYGNLSLHKIYALDKNGNVLASWPKYLGGAYSPGMPMISDVDHDGQLELIAACFGVYVWDLPGSGPPGQLVEWGDYRHDTRRTGLHGAPLLPPSPPPPPPPPSVIYVDASIGADSCDGSSPVYQGWPVCPKHTIQAGIDAISAGDTCQVAAGTYTETITMKEGILLKGAGAWVSVIDGGGNGPVVTGADNSEIDGFTVTGAAPDGFPDASGIYCEGTSMTITNNVIYNIALYPVFVRNASPLIQSNTIIGSGNNGIYNSNGSGAIIRNNLIYLCTGAGIYCLNTSDTLRIENNTIIHNAFGLDVQNSPSGIAITNNIITNNTTGIYVSGNAPSMSYNDVWNNTQNYSGSTAGPGDISLDPLFVDPSALDCHLQAGSPCIDAGTDVGQPYSGAAPDMGAFEYE